MFPDYSSTQYCTKYTRRDKYTIVPQIPNLGEKSEMADCSYEADWYDS